MVKGYIYLFIILIIGIIGLECFITSKKYAPKKIKIMSLYLMIILYIKIVSLLILLLNPVSNKILYIANLVNLNVIYIPCLMLICIFIYIRKESFKLDYIGILIAIITLFYITIIIKSRPVYELTQDIGYIIHFKNHYIMDYIYLITLVGISLFNIQCIGKIRNDSENIILLILMIITIAEYFTNMLGINILPYFLLSDLIWIITYKYFSNKFKVLK